MKKTIFRNLSAVAVAAVVFTALVFYCIQFSQAYAGEEIWIAALQMLPIIIAVAVIMILAANYVSKKITGYIINQLNSVDLDNIGGTEVCEELSPFLERIEKKNLGKSKTEEMRREFSANVSHELKTPLTSISGYAQMINNGMAKPEDYLTFTRRIEKEASRLILLINDIIRLSNLDEENNAPEEEVLDLSVLAQETIVELEKASKDKNVQIYYSGKETYISGNRTLIGELMFNLIDNAIKYNKEKGNVTVFVGTVAQGAVFSVKDTGIGIPEEDIDRIFERFYRVDKSHSKTVGGTGLGLSIVKHIAICHNAKIHVKSAVGKGTTVSVVFNQN